MGCIICQIKLWFNVHPLTDIWDFFDKLNYVGHENFKSFPNTAEEIIEETNRIETIKKKTDEALNERNEEITSDFILQSKKDLIKSMTDNVDVLSQDEINKVSLIALPKIIEKK